MYLFLFKLWTPPLNFKIYGCVIFFGTPCIYGFSTFKTLVNKSDSFLFDRIYIAPPPPLHSITSNMSRCE